MQCQSLSAAPLRPLRVQPHLQALQGVQFCVDGTPCAARRDLTRRSRLAAGAEAWE